MANLIRIKRRLSGSPDAPASLKNAEPAFNEVSKILYYGLGSDVNNDATNILPIGGEGAFVTRYTNQDISGDKIFTGDVEISGLLTTDDITITGGDLDANTASLNLFNSPTTIDFGSSADISLGSPTSTTTVNNDLNVLGDLSVQGTFTTINSTTVTVDDKNIELGSTETPTDSTADGGGITLKGDIDKTIVWDNANNNWTSSENWNIASGKVFKINNTEVLSDTTLGSSVVSSSLTSVGTLNTGTWNADVIEATYGGTGVSTYTKGSILYANSIDPTALSKLAIGSYDTTNEVGQMLQVSSDGTINWSWNINGGEF